MKKYKSILHDNAEWCYLCGRYLRGGGDWHHVFNASNKKNSEKYGLLIKICRSCHDELHFGKHGAMEKLKRRVQWWAMNWYGWSVEDFISIFGRSYL